MKKVKSYQNYVNIVDECLTQGVANGIFQVKTQDDVLDGSTITVDGKKVVSFGSCSYLGLEVDERLKKGAINATMAYGTQYSSSRLFSECKLYQEAEDLFTKIFEAHVILVPTTTLAHVAALPILINDEDAIILDHQVHGSVQLAVQLTKQRGICVDMIRHNNLNELEDKIKALRNKYHNIWYMADGLYSMYGDFAPTDELKQLLDKYPQLHLYVDDAHAMSWYGKNGKGFAPEAFGVHPRVVIATSLAKAFGAGGAVLILPTAEMKRKILTCGSSLTFSGPIQPPVLGAIIESAKIHLTPEIYLLQTQLQQRIEFCYDRITHHGLPLVAQSGSPIIYMALGLPKVGYNMAKRVLDKGYYINIGIFPGVPVKCTGVRLAISVNQSFENIERVVTTIRESYPEVLANEEQKMEDVSAYFGMDFKKLNDEKDVSVPGAVEGLTMEYKRSINQVDENEWNTLLGDNGSFDYGGMQFLEDSFSGNPTVENNWRFHYFIVRDHQQQPVLATFFTESVCKDDMLSPAHVSEKIEERRKNDPYYLTSRIVTMGSLLSEGTHMYVNREHPHWKKAVQMMLTEVNGLQRRVKATELHLRDFESADDELKELFLQEGFVRVEMPAMHAVENLSWNNEEEYLQRLSLNAKKHVKKYIFRHLHRFDVKIHEGKIPLDKIDYWYQLYKNVKNKSFSFNTFDLPRKLFYNICNHPQWEVIELYLKPEYEKREIPAPVAVVFNYMSITENYCPFIIGLNYDFQKDFFVYRQSLYQVTLRARNLKAKKMYMGMEASIEKQKIGAIVIDKVMYLQANNNFQRELINLMKHVN